MEQIALDFDELPLNNSLKLGMTNWVDIYVLFIKNGNIEYVEYVKSDWPSLHGFPLQEVEHIHQASYIYHP